MLGAIKPPGVHAPSLIFFNPAPLTWTTKGILKRELLVLVVAYCSNSIVEPKGDMKGCASVAQATGCPCLPCRNRV